VNNTHLIGEMKKIKSWIVFAGISLLVWGVLLFPACPVSATAEGHPARPALSSEAVAQPKSGRTDLTLNEYAGPLVLKSGMVVFIPSATGTYKLPPQSGYTSRGDNHNTPKRTVIYFVWDKSPAGIVNIPYDSLPDKIKCLSSIPDGEMVIWVGDEGDPRFTIRAPAGFDPDTKIVIGKKDCLPNLSEESNSKGGEEKK